MLRLIALEEHYILWAVAVLSRYTGLFLKFIYKLESHGDEGIQDFDNAAISVQLLFHGPVGGSPAMCLKANNELAQVI